MAKDYSNLVEDIRESGREALKPLYLELKSGFLQYFSRYSSDLNLITDTFHEAMIAFYEYCIKGKYDHTKSSPKTMIYTMGKAYIINRLKSENRQLLKENSAIEETIKIQMRNQLNWDMDELSTQLQFNLQQLGNKCQKLLQLFYYEQYSINQIAEKMQYKNVNVVSSHKSRCIKQLKALLKKEV